jgi:hypothetical protein
MDDESVEPGRDTGVPPGIAPTRFSFLRGRREPLWVIGLIITLPLIAVVIIAVARLLLHY